MKLIFNTRDELTLIKIDHISYLESDGNYTNVFFINGVKTTLLASLTTLENLIAERFSDKKNIFIRLGKKYIVNSTQIFQISIPRQRLILSDLETTTVYSIPVAKEALKSLKALLVPNTKKPE